MILFLTLIACSDYNLATAIATETDLDTVEELTGTVVVEAEDVPVVEDTASAVVDNEEPVEEDTGDELVSSDECGFLNNQWYANPDVETESLAIFSNIGDLHFEIRQGETARYQFAVTALDCGDIDLNRVIFQVDDETCWTEDCWIGEIALDYLPMYLTNQTDGVTYEPYNMSQQIHNLTYGWRDEETDGAYTIMDTTHVTAGTTKIFELNFTATQNIPVGNTIRIFLADTVWTDSVTGNDVCGVDDCGTELAVTYTVVE